MRISADGWYEFIMPADWKILGWAMARDEANPPPCVQINPLVLIELVHDYFRFMYMLLVPRTAPGPWQVWIRALEMKTAGVELSREYLPRMFRYEGIFGTPMKPSSDNWAQNFTSTGDAETDAFQALQRLYALWSLGADAIPFTNGDRVDPQKFAKVYE